MVHHTSLQKNNNNNTTTKIQEEEEEQREKNKTHATTMRGQHQQRPQNNISLPARLIHVIDVSTTT